MYSFQSLGRSFDIQLSNKRVVSFNNYFYSTNDPELGEELKRKQSLDFWLISDGSVTPVEEEKEVVIPKRRGRPPKVVSGARSSELAE
jgi:hypothetical protein